jgi:hypothetical protein
LPLMRREGPMVAFPRPTNPSGAADIIEHGNLRAAHL